MFEPGCGHRHCRLLLDPQPAARPYDVTVAAPGFSTAKESGLQLTVGAEQTLNIPMKLGKANQTVQFEAAAPLVQLGSSTISSDVDSKQILEMPLNGRSWNDLATLIPGVNAIEPRFGSRTARSAETGALGAS